MGVLRANVGGTWIDIVGAPGPQGPPGSTAITTGAIVELATTPAGTTNELRWSTTHQAMVRWNGTQWVFAGGPPSYLTRFDAFQYQAGLYGEWNLAAVNSGTVARVQTSIQAGHGPAVALGSDVTLGNSGGVLSTFLQSIAPTPGMRFRSVFRIPAGLTTATHRQGIHDSVTFNDANDGIYLEVASYTARFKSAASGTRTTNGTTATLLADTWYTAHIWFVTTTTARCVITQDNGTVALDVTNTTNVPGNSRVARASFVATNTPAATADLVYVDSVGIGYSAI